MEDSTPMAHLEQRGEHFRLIFQFAGKRYARTLKTNDPKDAEIVRGGAEKVLYRLENRLVELPAGA
jgi:hypothetical protein